MDFWIWLSIVLIYYMMCLDGMNDGIVGNMMRDVVMVRGVSVMLLFFNVVFFVVFFSRIGLNFGYNC